jgi:glycerate 2-kinase
MQNRSFIQNRAQLETSPLRRMALDILEAGLRRVRPEVVMLSALQYSASDRLIRLPGHVISLEGWLFVIGGGKAAGLMAQTLEQIVGAQTIADGLIIDKAPPREFDLHSIRAVQAGHPLPDQRGLEAMQQILRLKSRYKIGPRDMVLCLISGGGSALMPAPWPGLSLADKQRVTRLLLNCGAPIQEINTLRKHLSSVKGGRLAAYFAPATLVSLILSDVIGNDLSVIASGPTYPDQTTYADALQVLEKYALLKLVPPAVPEILRAGARGEIPETPKALDNVSNYIIGDVGLALQAMSQKAVTLGFRPLIISDRQKGDTAALAAKIAAAIHEGRYREYNALLLGGETTPTLPPGHGRGGRNQHYAACTIHLLQGLPCRWVAASLGTDGSDFIPEVAGAIVDDKTAGYYNGHEADFQKQLAVCNSNPLLAMTPDSLIITGPTYTNVGDVVLYLLDSVTGC